MQKLRLTAVSYLNTKPFLYGIFREGLDELLDIQLDIPSVCAERLTRGDADLGLVPVAAIPYIPGANILSNYCIGSTDAVRTVCIYSDCPLEEVETLYLDFHSRTSVQLVRILLRDYWKLQPKLLKAEPGFENLIGGTRAGLVIGDRTIPLEKKHPYIYDLGSAWKAHTGLPFVFAAWVSTRPLGEDFIERFNQALQTGLDFIPQLVYLLPTPEHDFDLKRYFTENISYLLDEPKREALTRFLSELGVPDNHFSHSAVSP